VKPPTDPNCGNWDRQMYKDDNRKDFLSAFGEAILPAWKILDVNEIRQSILATLDLSQVATVGLVVEASNVACRYRQGREE